MTVSNDSHFSPGSQARRADFRADPSRRPPRAVRTRREAGPGTGHYSQDSVYSVSSDPV